MIQVEQKLSLLWASSTNNQVGSLPRTSEHRELWNRWRRTCVARLPWNVPVQLSAIELQVSESCDDGQRVSSSGLPRDTLAGLEQSRSLHFLAQLAESRVEVTYQWRSRPKWKGVCSLYLPRRGWLPVDRWPTLYGSNRIELLSEQAVDWLKKSEAREIA